MNAPMHPIKLITDNGSYPSAGCRNHVQKIVLMEWFMRSVGSNAQAVNSNVFPDTNILCKIQFRQQEMTDTAEQNAS